MRAVLERIRREPAVVVGLVGALIALGLAFGLNLSVEQQGAIMGLVIAVLAFVTRSQVTPTRAVAASEEDRQAGADLVAGPASSLPDDTHVNVVRANDAHGEGP